MLRDMVTTWARANCPTVEVQEYLLRHLDQATQRSVSCSFTIGESLTKAGRPYMVRCFHGEFFVFELSLSQVARLGLKDNEVAYAESPCHEPQVLNADPIVCLQDVAVDQAAALSREVPITGTLRYQAKRVLLQPLSIRVVCEPSSRNSITLSHHLYHLAPREGAVNFSMQPLGNCIGREGKPFVGIVPLFFQIWTEAELQQPALPEPFKGTSFGKPANQRARTQPGMPTHLCPPPSNDRAPQSAAQALRPVSDIRAVLVDVS
jgi:hypothetical protein